MKKPFAQVVREEFGEKVTWAPRSRTVTIPDGEVEERVTKRYVGFAYGGDPRFSEPEDIEFHQADTPVLLMALLASSLDSMIELNEDHSLEAVAYDFVHGEVMEVEIARKHSVRFR